MLQISGGWPILAVKSHSTFHHLKGFLRVKNPQTQQSVNAIYSATGSSYLQTVTNRGDEIEEHPELELTQTASVARSQRHPILAGPFLPHSMRTQCFLQHFREGGWKNRQRKCKPCTFHIFSPFLVSHLMQRFEILNLSCRFPLNCCLSPVHCWMCSEI